MLALTAVALGTLPGWLTLVALVASAWLFYRGGTGTAVSGLQDTNRELERQIKERDAKVTEREGQLSALERINAELRAQTDVTVAITPVLETLQMHEERAQERHERMLIVLELIANRLGPDPNGGSNGTENS